MKLESTFDIGQKVWVGFSGCPQQGTVGLVRVQVIDSPGINGGAVEERAPNVRFDNYMPMKSTKEEYMLVETGIETGSVYCIDDEQQTIFATEAACQRFIDSRKEALV